MKGVTARQQGDVYQARTFWLEACRLFQPHTKVERVGHEIDDVPHFDDVAVIYSKPILDAHGEAISADYYQIRWHVDQSGSLTCDALTDPLFMSSNKTSLSLLQRLHEAIRETSASDQTARFTFVTTWSIRHGDPLAELVSGRDGELRLDRLFSLKYSKWPRLVKCWSSHLGVGSEELRNVLSRLRLCPSSYSLDSLTRMLSEKMAWVGLAPIEYGSRSGQYDSVIMRLLTEGQTMFTASMIQIACEREGLWMGSDVNQDAPRVGIRSFLRFAEHLEDEVDHLLDLVDLFDGREIRVPEAWNTSVGPRIRAFVNESVVPLQQCRLYLSAHSSIAFATGYELEPKSGVQISLVQNTAGGRSVWEVSQEPTTQRERLWNLSEVNVNSGSSGTGIVLSVTHDARHEVLAYVREHVPQLGRMLIFTVKPSVGQQAVKDGYHAWQLAQEVVRSVQERYPRNSREGPLHVFGAAPNGLVFFLGRLARILGPMQLYEHAFESARPGYWQSLSLPIAVQSKLI